MSEEIECPRCGNTVDVEMWVCGYCPTCDNYYTWDEWFSEDYSDSYAYALWDDCTPQPDTNWSQDGARTGRLSTQEENKANLPKPEPKYEILVNDTGFPLHEVYHSMQEDDTWKMEQAVKHVNEYMDSSPLQAIVFDYIHAGIMYAERKKTLLLSFEQKEEAVDLILQEFVGGLSGNKSNPHTVPTT